MDINKMFARFRRKKEVKNLPLEETPKEKAVSEINAILRQFNFPERDEILQSSIKHILSRKHIKYKPNAERYEAMRNSEAA
jgi:hypothetical protein